MKWGCQHGYGNIRYILLAYLRLDFAMMLSLSKDGIKQLFVQMLLRFGKRLTYICGSALKSGYLVQVHYKNFFLGQ